VTGRTGAGRLAALVVALGLAFLLPAGCRRAPPPQDAGVYLERMVQGYEALQDYQATVRLVFVLPGDDRQELLVRQWFRKPNLHRAEVLEPEVFRGQVTLYDGKDFWFYSPLDEEAFRYRDVPPDLAEKDQAHLLGDLVAQLRQATRVTRVGSESVGGRPAVVLELAPTALETGAAVARQRVWLDEAWWLPVRVESYDQAGRVVAATEYLELRVNAGLDPETFRFVPPPGTRVSEASLGGQPLTREEAAARLGFRPREPAELPPGLRLVAISEVGEGDERAIVFDYGDGQWLLSLTQRSFRPDRPAMAGLPRERRDSFEAQVLETRDFTVLHWVVDGVELVLMGNLPKDELFEVARSVR